MAMRGRDREMILVQLKDPGATPRCAPESEIFPRRADGDATLVKKTRDLNCFPTGLHAFAL